MEKSETIELSNVLIKLDGVDRTEALRLLEKEQAEFVAKPQQILDQQILERGLFRHKKLLLTLPELKLVWVRRGRGFFHTPNMFPLKPGHNILQARSPVYARFFEKNAILLLNNKPYHYKNLMGWVLRLFSLGIIRPRPSFEVYRVPEPLFRRFFQPRLDPN